MSTTERDWIEEVGAPAYAAIEEMVAALQADYDRLEELRDERDSWEPEEELDGQAVTPATWADACPDDAEELHELEASVGDCEDEDSARERITEDPLSLRVFGERVEGEWRADNYELLLTTGGPAVRIIGDLDDSGEPTNARLQVQDWGKPWTDYFEADSDVLMAYVQCFCFGE